MKPSQRQCPWCLNIISRRGYRKHVQKHAAEQMKKLGLQVGTKKPRSRQ